MLKECKLLERVSLLVTLYFKIRNTKNLFSNAMYRICLWMFLCLIWGAEFWYEYEYDINLHNFFQKSLYLHKNCRRNLFILNGFFLPLHSAYRFVIVNCLNGATWGHIWGLLSMYVHRRVHCPRFNDIAMTLLPHVAPWPTVMTLEIRV